MKKRTGRMLSILLCFAMLLGLMPAAVLAAESGTLETGLTWTLENGVLTISGQGAMPDWGAADQTPWYASKDSITSLVVEEGVTSVGKSAFYGCSNVTSVTLPQQSLTSIGESSFCGAGITDLQLPDTVQIIGASAFYYCANLQSVKLPRDLTVLQNTVFDMCQNLISVELPRDLTTICSGALGHCTKLESIAIPASVTNIAHGDSVTSAFTRCDGLQSITVEAGNTVYHADGNCLIETATGTLFQGCNNSVIPQDGSVTSIGRRAFHMMKGLTQVTIPESVTTIGSDAFLGSGLTSVTIPGTVKTIGDGAFNACYSLSSVALEEGLEIVDGSAFSSCKLLTSIVIPSSVTEIRSRAFYNDTGLEKITILSENAAFTSTVAGYENEILPESTVIYGYEGSTAQTYAETYGRTFYVLAETSGELETGLTWNLDEQGVLTVSGQGAMPDWTPVDDIPWYPLRDRIMAVTIDSGVTTVGGLAFAYCPNLEAVSLPRTGLTRIGSMAFAQSGLNTIYIPDTVTGIGAGAFRSCGELTYVHLPDGLETLQSLLFCDCYQLADINFPSALTTIQNGVFTDCRTLTNIVIPAGVTSIDFSEARAENPFFGCTGLESITVEEGNTVYHADGNCLIETASKTLLQGCNNSDIPTDGSVTSIGFAAFYGMSGREVISLPDTVTAIGSYAFASCCRDTDDDGWVDQGLRQIYIPGSVKTIGEAAFNNSRLLSGVYIMEDQEDPNDGLETIGGWAFVACVELSCVEIPATVTNIGSRAFYESGLTEVWIYTRAAEFESNDYNSPDEILPGDVVIYGYLNSTAHDYAKTYGRTFRPLDTMDEPVSCNHGNCEVRETATCTQTGKQITICLDCGAVMVEELDALGHMVSNTVVYTKAPTCTEDGVGYNPCERCGEPATETYMIQALGHEPDTTRYGYDNDGHWHPCTRCGEKCGEEDHLMSNDVTVIKETTCTEDGVSEVICAVCGHTYTHIEPAFGHYTYGMAMEHDAEKHWTPCWVCGEHVNEAAHAWSGWQPDVTSASGKQTRTCEICGRSETVVVSTEPDEDNNYMVAPDGDEETTVTEITVDRSVVDDVVNSNANSDTPSGLTFQLGKKTSVTYDAGTLEAIQKAVEESMSMSPSAVKADLILRVKGYGDTDSLVEEEELTTAQSDTVYSYESNDCWTVVLTATYYNEDWVTVDATEVDFDGGDDGEVAVTVECDFDKYDVRNGKLGVARVEEDGSLTPVESETNEENGTITWFSRHHSLYMVYVKDEGVTVSGQTASYNPNNQTAITLYAAEDTAHETALYTAAIAAETGSGQVIQNFAITGVAPGIYDLVVTKAGHLTYTIKGVVVGSTDLDLTKNANASVSTITLLAGDVDEDGNINESDVSVIRYASNINKLASSAANSLADVDGDGNVNESDVSIVRYAVHINKNAGHCTYVYAPKE